MILLNGKILKTPTELNELPIDVKNQLLVDMEKGHVLFLAPDDFKRDKNFKNNRITYRIGFMDDCLAIMYPKYSVKKRQEIISDKYFFDLTYRRFHDLYLIYDENRTKYLTKRELLGLFQ